jgi:hypothetical protein
LKAAAEKAEQVLAAFPAPPVTPAPSIEVPEAKADPARARARVTTQHHRRGPAPPPLRQAQVGTRVRQAADTAEAQNLTQLAKVLKPGHKVRITRLRPSWAAGWIEDYMLDAGDDLTSVYEYLREEYGGAKYEIMVLAGSTPMYEASIAVAGPPRDRGRVINRDVWEGASSSSSSSSSSTPATVERTSSDGAGLAVITTFAKMFIDSQQRATDAQLASVRDMVQATQRSTGELATAVLENRERGDRRQSLGAQLNEVVEATRAVERVKKAIGAVGVSRAGAAEEPDDMRELGREATRFFMRNVLEGMSGGGKPAQNATPGPRGQLRRLKQNPGVGIPTAQAAGQSPRKN